MSMDMLVGQCYLNHHITCGPNGFAFFVPYLCECYRTPLFASTQLEFYALVLETFDQHPKRTKSAWETSQQIYKVEFNMGTARKSLILAATPQQYT
jgi:hypothetical protein